MQSAARNTFVCPRAIDVRVGVAPSEPATGDAARGMTDATTTRFVAQPADCPDDRFDERALVESARHDANAFAELYRRYVDRIHDYCLRRSGSRAVAEDVTSTTFEKALRGLHGYTWREPGIGPWLFRIASNELVDHYRRDGRQRKVAESLRTMATAEEPRAGARLETRDEVLAALGSIRPRYQRALSLRYFADLTNEEAAAAMGVSRATMAVIVHRGAAAMRKAIEAARSEGVRTRG